MATKPGGQERLTEAEIVAAYGDSPVMINGTETDMTLADALAFEATFCTVAPDRRQDPDARISYLARILKPHLRPEHRYLLPEESPDETR
jgi:hypothetical protein